VELLDQCLVMALDVVPNALLGLGEKPERILDLVRAKPEDLFCGEVDNSDTVDLGRIRNEAVALCVVEKSKYGLCSCFARRVKRYFGFP
jgi:hypothetical protein